MTSPGGTRNRVKKADEHRRERGSGGVRQLGDNLWRIDIELARDSVTGHRRRVARSVHGSRAQTRSLHSRG